MTHRWKIDKTTQFFVETILEEDIHNPDSKIIKFRNRWKLGNFGLLDKSFFLTWKKKIQKECQAYIEEVKISEIELYVSISDTYFPQPVLSSDTEKRVREEQWGKDIKSVFQFELMMLARDLKLPAELNRFLEYFVIYNIMDFDLIINRGITTTVRFRFSEKYGVLSENVNLILGENTSSEDLDNFWDKKVNNFLKNLITRIKGLKRKGRYTWTFKEFFANQEKLENMFPTYTDKVDGSKIKVGARELIIEKMTDEKLDKLYEIKPDEEAKDTDKRFNKILNRKVHNSKYYRSKQNSKK